MLFHESPAFSMSSFVASVFSLLFFYILSIQYDFGADTCAGNEPLYLLGGQVLRLIDDDSLFCDGAAPDKRDRFRLNDISVKQLVDFVLELFFTAVPLARIIVHQHLQVINDRTEERSDFFLLGSRQESDVLVKFDVGAAYQDLPVWRVGALRKHFMQAHSQ